MASGMSRGRWNGRSSVENRAGSGDPRTTRELRVRQDAAGFVEEDAAEVHLESFGIGGLEKCFFFGDSLFFDQFEKRLVEGLHTFVRAGFDGGKKFIEEILFDEFADGPRINHDFD